jgi:tripartite-type tricarboxylate transporter receptor subunit TctC
VQHQGETNSLIGTPHRRFPLSSIVNLSLSTFQDQRGTPAASTAEKRLGQPIVVENRPGAGTTLAPGQMAAAAKPDGYTICQLGLPVLRTPALRKTPYDPGTDFTYIIGVVQLVSGLVVRRDAPWSTLGDLIDAARRSPGTSPTARLASAVIPTSPWN